MAHHRRFWPAYKDYNDQRLRRRLRGEDESLIHLEISVSTSPRQPALAFLWFSSSLHSGRTTISTPHIADPAQAEERSSTKLCNSCSFF
ncbi:hypothetical protein ACOSP7_027945 [Xanthoceras sorbifolium]